jgi:hypothetical protein
MLKIAVTGWLSSMIALITDPGTLTDFSGP